MLSHGYLTFRLYLFALKIIYPTHAQQNKLLVHSRARNSIGYHKNFRVRQSCDDDINKKSFTGHAVLYLYSCMYNTRKLLSCSCLVRIKLLIYRFQERGACGGRLYFALPSMMMMITIIMMIVLMIASYRLVKYCLTLVMLAYCRRLRINARMYVNKMANISWNALGQKFSAFMLGVCVDECV